jgi:hypothetical protein
LIAGQRKRAQHRKPMQIMERNKKEIVITNDSLLADIQDAFSAAYPFLMIEFFRNDKCPLTSRHVKIAPGTPLKDLMSLQAMQVINIGSQRTVSEVLRDCIGTLGLTAQICRKSGNVWNAVSLTDGWTLDRQNAAGEYISAIMAPPQPQL